MSDSTKPATAGRSDRAPKQRRPSKAGRQSRPRRPPKADRAVLRHQARVLALQTLYEVDLTGHAVEDAVANDLDDESGDDAPEAGDGNANGNGSEPGRAGARPTGVRDHAERLVRGTRASLAEIDPLIVEAAPAFPLAHLPAVDRNVLRLALYELIHEPAVPTRAAINEAVELAKRFGGEGSGRFVNGVLGTLVARIPSRADAATPRPADRRPPAGADQTLGDGVAGGAAPGEEG